MRISILSNVNMDMLAGLLKKDHEIHLISGYGGWISCALRPDPELSRFDPECLLLLLDGNELLRRCGSLQEQREELRQTKEYVRQLAGQYPSARLLVSTIDVTPDLIRAGDDADDSAAAAAYWEECLSKLTEEHGNLHRFELRNLIADYGRRQFYSDRFWYMGSIPYDMKALHMLADQIRRSVERFRVVRRKVLVLDLDNTLWGGVIGEDGIEGIRLGSSHEGAPYQDAQKEIRKMQRQGVLLAIASKNNLEDVQKVFREHPQMILKEEDFAAVYADWNPKHENIRRMAAELNLGLDSFVFVDDNEAERKAVEFHLPEVAVAEFPTDIASLPAAMRRIYETYFFTWKLTDEDQRKTQQYREEKARRRDQEAAASYEDYLRSLETKIRMKELTPELRERAVQLMNKTNQFNVCTLRMDETKLEAYLSAGGHLILAEVSDRYGNSGWVVELLYHTKGDTAVVDNFLMSCRVMGRNVEDAFLNAVTEKLKEDGISCIQAFYQKTAKNKPVESFWESQGFEITCADEAHKEYRLLLDAAESEDAVGSENTAGRIHTVEWKS